MMAGAPEAVEPGVAVAAERTALRAALGGIATLGPLGRVPKAPGTAASLVAALAWILLAPPVGRSAWVALAALGLLGVAAAGEAARTTGKEDPSEVVIDEAVGMWLTLALVPTGLLTAAAGFVAFRAFDAIKPFPVRRFERLPGGWGIVADDLAAALYAAAAVRLLWAALG